MNKGARLATCAGVAALSFLGSVWSLVELNTGWIIPGVGLTEGLDDTAYRLAQEGKGQDLQRAERLVTHAVGLSPYQSAERTRLAYIDARRNGRLTPVGAKAIASSYDLLPFDPDVATWRIRFALEHWDSLTPDTRQAVLQEAQTVRTFSLSDLGPVLTSIQNPAGRFAAAMLLQRWDVLPTQAAPSGPRR